MGPGVAGGSWTDTLGLSWSRLFHNGLSNVSWQTLILANWIWFYSYSTAKRCNCTRLRFLIPAIAEGGLLQFFLRKKKWRRPVKDNLFSPRMLPFLSYDLCRNNVSRRESMAVPREWIKLSLKNRCSRSLNRHCSNWTCKCGVKVAREDSSLWNCGSGTVPSQHVAKIKAETRRLRLGKPWLYEGSGIKYREYRVWSL
jgi:hypothetical protein